jgi:hypothetical protein
MSSSSSLPDRQEPVEKFVAGDNQASRLSSCRRTTLHLIFLSREGARQGGLTKKAKVRESILNTIDSIEVRIVRNQVNCPHCGLPAAEYLTSDHTNESATLTVKHQEDGRVCTGRLSLLTSTFSRIRRRPSESQDDIDEAPSHSGPRCAIFELSRATVCGYGFAMYLRGLATGSPECLYGSLLPELRSEPAMSPSQDHLWRKQPHA